MKRASRLGLVAAFALALGAPATGDDAAPEEKLGYAIGHQVGGDFRRSGRPLDPDALIAGLRDALEGSPPRFDPGVMREALRKLEERTRHDAEVPAPEPQSP